MILQLNLHGIFPFLSHEEDLTTPSYLSYTWVLPGLLFEFLRDLRHEKVSSYVLLRDGGGIHNPPQVWDRWGPGPEKEVDTKPLTLRENSFL